MFPHLRSHKIILIPLIQKVKKRAGTVTILRKLKMFQSLLLWKLLWKLASNDKKNGGSWVKSLELRVLDAASPFIQVFLKF